MKAQLKILIPAILTAGLVSLVMMAEAASPYRKTSKETLHCVSAYVDCEALTACILDASSRGDEGDCINAQVTRLSDEGFEQIDDGDAPLSIGGIANGKRSVLSMLASHQGPLEVVSAPNDPLVLEGRGDGAVVVSGRGAVIDPLTQTIRPIGVGEPAVDDPASDAGVGGDAGVPEAAAKPEVVQAPPKDETKPPAGASVDTAVEGESLEKKRFAKGDMELSLGLGLAGDGNASYLGVGAKYAYYVIDKLAPGIDLSYTHIFVDEALGIEYPESFTVLPFLKYVITQKTVAPFVFVKGGYDFEWGVSNSVNAWVLGLGAGVHVAVGKHLSINIELAGLHYWYSGKKQYWYEDDSLLAVDEARSQKVSKAACENSGGCGPEGTVALGDNEQPTILVDRDGNQYECTDDELCVNNTFTDKKDVSREWFFPLVTLGLGFYF